MKNKYHNRSKGFIAVVKRILLFIVIISIAIFSFAIPRISDSQVYGQCSAPTAVQNVKVHFPDCQNGQCSFSTAGCSWDNTVNGATSYSVRVTEIETGNVIKNDTQATTVSRVSFPVTSGRTYKCDVSAVNSCGTGVAGTDSVLCEVDAESISPTSAPQQSTPPTAYVPPPTQRPTLPPTGAVETTITVGAIMLALIGVGSLLFFL